jgi:hypothetical protein
VVNIDSPNAAVFRITISKNGSRFSGENMGKGFTLSGLRPARKSGGQANPE